MTTWESEDKKIIGVLLETIGKTEEKCQKFKEILQKDEVQKKFPHLQQLFKTTQVSTRQKMFADNCGIKGSFTNIKGKSLVEMQVELPSSSAGRSNQPGQTPPQDADVIAANGYIGANVIKDCVFADGVEFSIVRQGRTAVHSRPRCEKCRAIPQSHGNKVVTPRKLARGQLQVQLEAAGTYECSETGLVFEVSERVLVRYSVLSWSEFGKFLKGSWKAAGPIFNVDCVESDSSVLKSIQFPHSLCLADPDSEMTFSILHMEDSGPVIEPSAEHSGSHVKWHVSSLSPVGPIVQSDQPIEHNGVVLVYQELGHINSYSFRIYLANNNSSDIKDIGKKLRFSKKRYLKINKPPTCNLGERQYRLMSEPAGDINPENLFFTLDVTMLKDYFEVFFEHSPPFKLLLLGRESDKIVWSTTIRERDCVDNAHRLRKPRKCRKSSNSTEEEMANKRPRLANYSGPKVIEVGGSSKAVEVPLMQPPQHLKEELKEEELDFLRDSPRHTHPPVHNTLSHTHTPAQEGQSGAEPSTTRGGGADSPVDLQDKPPTSESDLAPRHEAATSNGEAVRSWPRCEKCRAVPQNHGNKLVTPRKLARGHLEVQLEAEGTYECSETGLVFEVSERVLVRYSVLSWSKFGKFLKGSWKAAGPIFNVDCVESESSVLKSIQFPHSLCLADQHSKMTFSILHIKDSGPVIEPSVDHSGSHVKWHVSSLSPVGPIVQSDQPIEHHGVVLVYWEQGYFNPYSFRIYLAANNYSDIKHIEKEVRWSTKRYLKIEKPPTCELGEKKYHLTSEKGGDINPENLFFTLDVTMVKGYFEALIEDSLPFKLSLKEESKKTVWSAIIIERDCVDNAHGPRKPRKCKKSSNSTEEETANKRPRLADKSDGVRDVPARRPGRAPQMSEKQLLQVAKGLGKEWKQAGIILDLSWKDLEDIQASDTDVRIQRFKMLALWRNRRPAGRASTAHLWESLQELDDLPNEVREILHDMMNNKAANRRL